MRLNSLRLALIAALATAALSACVFAPAPGYPLNTTPAVRFVVEE